MMQVHLLGTGPALSCEVGNWATMDWLPLEWAMPRDTQSTRHISLHPFLPNPTKADGDGNGDGKDTATSRQRPGDGNRANHQQANIAFVTQKTDLS